MAATMAAGVARIRAQGHPTIRTATARRTRSVVSTSLEREIDRASGQQDGWQEVAGVAVGFPHHRRGAVVAGLFHQVNEPRQRGLLGGIGHPDVEQAVTVQGARKYLVPLALVAGHGFSRDRALVDRRLAPLDRAIGGDALAGAHHDQVAGLQVLDMDFDLLAIAQHAGLVGQLVHEAMDRPVRSARRPRPPAPRRGA